MSKEKRRWVGVGFDLGTCVLLQKPCLSCIFLQGWLGPQRERGTDLVGNKKGREAHQLTGRSNCESPG